MKFYVCEKEDSLDEDFPSWQPAIDTLGAPTLGKQLTAPQQNDPSDLISKLAEAMRCFIIVHIAQKCHLEHSIFQFNSTYTLRIL